MGHGMVVECRSCQYARRFHLGIGMMHWSLDNVKNAIHHTRRDEIMAIMRSRDSEIFG